MPDARGDRTLTEAVGEAIDGRLVELRTASPGRIVSYDAAGESPRATVQPLLLRRTAAGELVRPKPIPNVPVIFARGGGFAMTMPLAAGDDGLLIVSDRSLDRWLETGGQVDPADGRRHQLTDAIFLPGLHAWPDAVPAAVRSPTEWVLAHESGASQLRIGPSKVAVRGVAGAVSPAIVDGVSLSLHTALASALTEIAALLAALGLPATTTTTTVIPALNAGTWRATKLEGE